ncbi:hypothetical protein N7495_005369 [Penicillium taxi]|uniref:uncharacterized protein n=1 Tax=Penicillium taxi TaxID=168475 RepID=UPI0025454882|nr:uncharacterized protein N7495_005369 [Penicillium taxi]KAJ5893678.1 hypothetical protein N7495_005369 [Penicillium taxi]
MSTISTLERSLSVTPSTSPSMSPPSLREPTSPGSEESFTSIHERMNQLDSRVYELRSTVITKDGYIDRRNREDDHIRREFQNHRTIYSRIDNNVVALRSDIEEMKTGIFQLRLKLDQSGTETGFLRSDVDRLQKTVDQLQADTDQMRSDVCTSSISIAKLQTTTNNLRTDFAKMSNQLNGVSGRIATTEMRIATIESRLAHSERIRFNSLAQTSHANINTVPHIHADGSLEWPIYFPRTVWRFWCLKKRSRVHRLIELAEFYELDHQSWARMQNHDMFADDSDSSSSDESTDLSLAEAVRCYPEAAHRALAAVLGLAYHKIQKQVGDDFIHRPQKRHQDEVSVKTKPAKLARPDPRSEPTAVRHPSPTESYVQRLVHGVVNPITSKSMSSEEPVDQLGWNPFPDVSDSGMNKLRSMDPQDINSILRGIERGVYKAKSSASEKAARTINQPKATQPRATIPVAKSEVPTQPNTNLTSPKSSRASVSDTAPASDSDSEAS